MSEAKPIEVAVVGGGCAGISAAFELTRPEHRGKYHVTVYQQGWRLGGKGASGRGPADRIEEHGFHVWLGFYENAFRLLRECYAELRRDPRECPFADWRDAFVPAPFVGVADHSPDGAWQSWMAHFPPVGGLPGDPLTVDNPFSVSSYLVRTASLLRTLLLACQARQGTRPDPQAAGESGSTDWLRGEGRRAPSASEITEAIARLLKYGVLATIAGVIEAARLLETVVGALARYPENIVLRLLDAIRTNAHRQIDILAEQDEEIRRLWNVIEIVLAGLRGMIRFGLAYDPRGFDVIDEYDCLEWLRLNGASERALNSGFVRGLRGLAFAYEDGDFQQPRLAAGVALRGTLRMFFTYRGALFWKMRAGMGDVVFAPYYEVLKRRGVSFKFFHRLANVRLADATRLASGERPYVEALDFDVQAQVNDGREYQPLVEIHGLPCWPAKPDYGQLVDGERLEREGWDFESFWERRKAGAKTLRVVNDFDFVVLAVGIGAIPHVCREIVARDSRWRAMVDHVKSVATQAFQVWMCEGMEELGWDYPLGSISGFTPPFDTMADMRHLIPQESWPTKPRAIAYFCGVLPDPMTPPGDAETDYPRRRRDEVRRNAIHFLNRDIGHLWPKARRGPAEFRWELLVDPAEQKSPGRDSQHDESRFESQFYTANVNPSDRYTLALPGSARHRISPLDNTYDNLTIAGDWTDCGYNSGCVEAAVMSGRLAAHALSQFPPLEDIIGYDHP